MTLTDTYDRSCAHWSEAGRTGMEAFYRLAARDYRLLAEAWNWAGLFRDQLDAAGESAGADGLPTLRVADIACGSGKFPAALLAHAGLASWAGEMALRVDLLDPSAFSITEARAALTPPLVPGSSHEVRLQDWVPPGPYGLTWATHALYCVPAEELAAGAAVLRTALAPRGLGVVAQGHRDGHYVGFYDRFLETFRGGRGTPYSDAAQVADALRAAGLEVAETTLTYQTEVPAEDVVLLERYLQRCAFDDTVPLDRMRKEGSVAAYLDAHLAPGSGGEPPVYRFPQRVGLLFYADDQDVLGRALGHRREASA